MSQQTESSIEIAASAADVMDVIADIDAYPHWAGVKAAKVLASFADGRPEVVEMTIDSGPITDTYTINYQWTGRNRVDWFLAESTVLRDLIGSYVVEDIGEGASRVTYRLEVELMIPIIGSIRRKAEKVIVDSALKGLKNRVES